MIQLVHRRELEMHVHRLAGASSVSGATATGAGAGGGAATSKSSALYSLDSSQRISYRPMARHPVLAVPHTRFGSNVPPKSEITQRVLLLLLYYYYLNCYLPYCATVTVLFFLVWYSYTVVLFTVHVQYKYILIS